MRYGVYPKKSAFCYSALWNKIRALPWGWIRLGIWVMGLVIIPVLHQVKHQNDHHHGSSLRLVTWQGGQGWFSIAPHSHDNHSHSHSHFDHFHSHPHHGTLSNWVSEAAQWWESLRHEDGQSHSPLDFSHGGGSLEHFQVSLTDGAWFFFSPPALPKGEAYPKLDSQCPRLSPFIRSIGPRGPPLLSS